MTYHPKLYRPRSPATTLNAALAQLTDPADREAVKAAHLDCDETALRAMAARLGVAWRALSDAGRYLLVIEDRWRLEDLAAGRQAIRQQREI